MELTPGLLREIYLQNFDYGAEVTMSNLQDYVKKVTGRYVSVALLAKMSARLASLNSDVRLDKGGTTQTYWYLIIGRKRR
jgi:hypothetical protein